MCSQVSDTPVSNPHIRHTVLAHAVLSFLYSTAFLAFVLNLVAGMAGGAPLPILYPPRGGARRGLFGHGPREPRAAGREHCAPHPRAADARPAPGRVDIARA